MQNVIVQHQFWLRLFFFVLFSLRFNFCSVFFYCSWNIFAKLFTQLQILCTIGRHEASPWKSIGYSQNCYSQQREKKPQMANGNVNGNGKYIREFKIFHYFGHCIIVTSCSRFLSEWQSRHGLVRNHRFGFSTPKDRNWLYCSMANEFIWPLSATAFYYSSSSCTLPRLLSLTWAKRITNDYFAFSFFLILFWFFFALGFFYWNLILALTLNSILALNLTWLRIHGFNSNYWVFYWLLACISI